MARGRGGDGGAPGAFRNVSLSLPPQTNEVRRSALLLPGFIEIARKTGLPLRLLEIGASAGLNQVWDEYRYTYRGRQGDDTWGKSDAEST